jgi:hypothetical protein
MADLELDSKFLSFPISDFQPLDFPHSTNLEYQFFRGVFDDGEMDGDDSSKPIESQDHQAWALDGPNCRANQINEDLLTPKIRANNATPGNDKKRPAPCDTFAEVVREKGLLQLITRLNEYVATMSSKSKNDEDLLYILERVNECIRDISSPRGRKLPRLSQLDTQEMDQEGSETDPGTEDQSSSDGQESGDESAPTVDTPRSSTSSVGSGPLATNGESRLRIHFENMGTIGTHPQKFGKSGAFIPDGLCGTQEMYDQQWRFETHHAIEKSGVLVVWKITNLTSGSSVEMKETPKEAQLRELTGRTISNKIVKAALSQRAFELGKSLEAFKSAKSGSRNQTIINTLENNLKVLHPKLCTVGLLFFGLLHDSVQTVLVGH